MEKETDILAIENRALQRRIYILVATYTPLRIAKRDSLKNLKDRIVKLIDSGTQKLDIELIRNKPTPDGDATVSFLLRNHPI